MISFINFHTHHPKKRSDTLNLYSADIRKFSHPEDLERIPSPFTLGIHPWWIDEIDKKEKMTFIEKTLSHSHCLALGEVGLDRAHDNIEKQMEFFKEQIEIAKRNNIEVIILHCVRAYSEIISIIKQTHYQGRFVFHDYNGAMEISMQLLKYDCYFSFGAALFRDNSKGLESFRSIPHQRIFLETDDNQNRSIEEVYLKAKGILELPLETLQKQIIKNFKDLFHLDESEFSKLLTETKHH